MSWVGFFKQPAQKVAGHRLGFWQAAHLSIQGDKHVRDGSPCQDESDSRALEDGAWAYVVVADGHGSDRHFRSDRGSALAVAAMRDTFHAFRNRARDLGEPGIDELAQLWEIEAGEVVARWRAKVHADLVTRPAQVPGKTEGERGLVRYLDDFAKRNGYAQLEMLFWQLRRFEEYARGAISKEAALLGPLPYFNDPAWDQAKFGGWQAKAYGTTVLGVLIGPDSLHWVQLGDGAMVQIVGGEATYLVPPPPEALGNLTPSLCDEDAQQELRYGTSLIRNGKIPSAVLLTTDGVPNSFAEIGGFFAFCQELAKAAPDLTQRLPGWLREMSRKGSGDDVSVAMAWLTELPAKRHDPPVEVPSDPHENTGEIVEATAEPVDERGGEELDIQCQATQGGRDPGTGRQVVEGDDAGPLEPGHPVEAADGPGKGSDRGVEDGR